MRRKKRGRSGKRQRNGSRERKSEEREEGGRWGKGPNIFSRDKHPVENKQEDKEMNGNLGP